MRQFSYEPDSICVRMGGDEFLVLTHCVSEDGLLDKEKRLSKLLEEYSRVNKLPIPLKTSIGYVACNNENESLEALVKKADAKMYEAKQKSKNRDC